MKNYLSILILIFSDVVAIFISISLAFFTRIYCEKYFDNAFHDNYQYYVYNYITYIIVIASFLYENIFQNRYDFWEDTRLVIKGLFLSSIIVLSFYALTNSLDHYSRFVITFSFVLMIFIIPVMKNIMKKLLFNLGLWKRTAEVFGDADYIKEEVFGNPYLGYVHSSHSNAHTIFIDTNHISVDELQERLDLSLKEKKEVLFIPLLQSYNFANVKIIELTNARKNLIVLENSLLKKSNVWIKKTTELFLAILLLPVLMVLFLIIIVLLKKEDPESSVFFKQIRMGYKGKNFLCYKFRSMHTNGDVMLESYLKENPEEVAYYEKFHKYKNDPRITKIGRILRRTSLDEVPQIINVLKGEMSLIGPRPYMPNEKEKIADKLNMVLATKPGITGLWQVSGRSEVDFHSRVDMDVWYTRNWNLWLDFVILVKTIKVVLFKDGAH